MLDKESLFLDIRSQDILTAFESTDCLTIVPLESEFSIQNHTKVLVL